MNGHIVEGPLESWDASRHPVLVGYNGVWVVVYVFVGHGTNHGGGGFRRGDLAVEVIQVDPRHVYRPASCLLFHLLLKVD